MCEIILPLVCKHLELELSRGESGSRTRSQASDRRENSDLDLVP